MKKLKKKIRDWLYGKFLPWETKEQYLKELEELRRRDEVQKRRIAELECYIKGVQDAIRTRAKIEINNGVMK